MDATGSNRYELLFMDDDGTPPATAVNSIKKKQATVTAKKAPAPAKKANVQSEKENKAGTLNKNEGARKGTENAPNSRAKPGATASGPSEAAVAVESGGKSRFGEGPGRATGFKPQNNDVREQRNNKRNFREGGAGYGQGKGGDYSNNENRQPRQFRDRDNRGPPRARFGENGFRGGKREFDRQSGSDKTGVKPVDKRDGAGAHNWGSVKEEIDDVNKSVPEADAVLTDKEESATENGPEQPAVPEEEEAKEMTLDEWKAMRQQRTKPQFNLRKAGEGEDTTQWKKMIVLNKKKEIDSEEELEYDPSMYPQRVGRLQRIMDIQFNFNDNRRMGGPGFGRGARRGARMGGDKGPGRFENGRGDAPRPPQGRPVRSHVDRPRGGVGALKVDDERQFPTLS